MPLFPGTLPDNVGATLPEAEDILLFPGTGGTFAVGLQATALTEDWTLGLPFDKGTVGQHLETDGAGQTSWEDVPAGTTLFTGLTDTPATYAGQSLLGIRVNFGESALEFVPFPAGGGDMTKATYDTGDNGSVDSAEALVTQVDAAEILVALDPVYVSGWDIGKAIMEVSNADASDPLKMNAFGLALTSVGANATLFVISEGVVRNINTTAWTAGDRLYVAAGGGLTNTIPPSATNTVQVVALVLREHATEGSLIVITETFDDFLVLLDTPTTYATHANKFVVVNGTETGLDFTDVAPSGSASWTSLAGVFAAVVDSPGAQVGDYFNYVSRVADGATAVAHLFDTDNALPTVGVVPVRFSVNGSKLLELGRLTTPVLNWFDGSDGFAGQLGYFGGRSILHLGSSDIFSGYVDGTIRGAVWCTADTVGNTSNRGPGELYLQTSAEIAGENLYFGLSPESNYGVRIIDQGRSITTNFAVLGVPTDLAIAIHPDGRITRSFTDGSAASLVTIQAFDAVTQGRLLDIGDDAGVTFVRKWSIGPDGSFGPAAYTLPSIDGTSGYVLKTDGAGSVTWQVEAGGGGGDPANWETSTGLFQIVAAQIAAGDRIYIRSRETDGAAQIAHVLDTELGFSAGGAKLLSIQNQGVEKFFADLDGGFGNSAYAFPAADGTVDQVLSTDGAGVLSFVTPTGGGVTTWLGLTDTDPADYVGQAGKFVKVNVGETGLDFGVPAGGGGGAALAVDLHPYAGEPTAANYATVSTRGGDRSTAVFPTTGVDSALMWTFHTPPGYAGGDLQFSIEWAGKDGAQGTADTVRWQVLIEPIASDSTDLDIAPTFTAVGFVDDVRPAATHKTTAVLSGTPPALTAGGLMRVKLLRVDSDAADTFDADAEVHGVLMEEL